MTIEPTLLLDDELALIRHDVGNTGFRQTQSNVERLLAHIAAQEQLIAELESCRPCRKFHDGGHET